jgi:predicted small secreted protein
VGHYKSTFGFFRIGVNGLEDRGFFGVGFGLKSGEMVKLWLEKDPNISIDSLKEMIEKEFKLKVSRSSVHNIMKSVGFSYITPRKSHYKQDQKQAEEFKKKSTKRSEGR